MALSDGGLSRAGLPSYQPPYWRQTLRMTNSGSSSDYRVADDETTDVDNAGRRRHERWRFHWRTDGNWVVFTDAGRGWMVGPRLGQTTYERDQFPALGTFRTDVGVGLDFDPVGVYVAKAVSDAKEPANFFVRVRKRF